MQVQIIDNKERQFLPIVAAEIAQARDVRIAVAFASRRGLDLIAPSLDTALSLGGTAEFLVGMDMHTTEPDALWHLFRLALQKPGLTLYCYSSLNRSAVYHPKVYLFSNPPSAAAIIGSSNLTSGGLEGNVEVNVLLTGQSTDEPIVDSYETYSRLKFLPGRVAPDEELLHMYENIRKEVKRQEANQSEKQALREVISKFQDKAATLRMPTATKADLIGWKELIYDSLPEGEFTNQQVYSLTSEYRKRFPKNKNIEAKIRQQLQFLENWGFVEHISRGRWRKV